MKVLIGDTIFTSPNGDKMDRHFTWSCEPHEGLKRFDASMIMEAEYLVCNLGFACILKSAAYMNYIL